MNNDKLRSLLSSKVDESEDIIIVTTEESTPDIMPLAENVIASYQNANKWLDSIKEYVLMAQGCVFFSNYIHNLAHTMPARFDKFGDILHTADIPVPYPATSSLEQLPADIEGVFIQISGILGAISLALREFIKATQDTEHHAMACSAEELLVDIEKEYTNLHRMRRAYALCEGDNIKFDKWCDHYISNLGKLID